MEEKNTPRRPRRNTDEQPKAAKNESLVYGKNPVTELLKSGSGVDTVLLRRGRRGIFCSSIDVFSFHSMARRAV